MTAMQILIVDDEPSLVAVLRPVLSAAGYEVAVVSDGLTAVSFVLANDPDVVLLDLGLPDIDGKEVIRQVRKNVLTPIIVISARHLEAEKIAALDEGADDYVNKPFEIGELMARIRAATRRRGATTTSLAQYQSGPLGIDFLTRLVTYDGENIKLSPKEWDLLQVLARSAGQVVTHRKLLTTGWGAETTDTQYLRVYISLLRQKIEADPSDPRLLLTEPGVGYRLAAAE